MTHKRGNYGQGTHKTVRERDTSWTNKNKDAHAPPKITGTALKKHAHTNLYLGGKDYQYTQDPSATSETCHVQGMEKSDGMRFGVQFHPEVNDSEFGSEIMRNFVEHCKSIQQL